MKEKSINIKTKDFEQNLLDLINNSQLPPANVYYVLRLIAKEVENSFYATLNDQAIEYHHEISNQDIQPDENGVSKVDLIEESKKQKK